MPVGDLDFDFTRRVAAVPSIRFSAAAAAGSTAGSHPAGSSADAVNVPDAASLLPPGLPPDLSERPFVADPAAAAFFGGGGEAANSRPLPAFSLASTEGSCCSKDVQKTAQ